VEFFLVN